MRLRTKIFWLTTTVVAVCLTFSVWVVEGQARGAMVREAEQELEATLEAVEVLATERRVQRTRWLRLLTHFPSLRQDLAAADREALARTLDEVSPDLDDLSLVAVLDRDGAVLASSGALADRFAPGRVSPPSDVLPLSVLGDAAVGRPPLIQHGLWRFGDDLVEVSAAPLEGSGDDPGAYGALLVGIQLEDRLAGRLRHLTDSHVILMADDELVASSLPRAELTATALAAFPLLSSPLDPGPARRVVLAGERFLAQAARVPIDYGGLSCNHVILRSLSEPLAEMRRLRRRLLGVGVLAIFAAFLVAWWGAKRIGDPLHRLAETMNRIAHSGRLEKPAAGAGRGGREVALFRDAFRRMVDSMQQSLEDRERGYIDAVGAVMTAVDHRDEESSGHSHRVGRYAVALARRLGLTGEQLQAVEWGALLHDVGKIAVPDAILRKDGPLDESEWRVIRRHPEWGLEMLSGIGFLRPALDIVGFHHERWDGDGYPHGLAGEDIPLAARIFSVVDTYDAITSDRHYRSAKSHRAACEELTRVAGSQLDPRVVEAFLEIPESEVRALRQQAVAAFRARTGETPRTGSVHHLDPRRESA